MFKKIIITVSIVLAISASFLYARENQKEKVGDTYFTYEYEGVSVWIAHNGCYSIPCYKCKCETLIKNRGYASCMGCPTWRCHGEKNKIIDGERYLVYRCQHGHRLLVSIDSPNLK